MAQEELLKSALMASPECLSAEQLEQVMEPGTPAPRLAAHLAECPRCQAELTLMKKFLGDERLEHEGAAVAWISAELERSLPQITGRAAGRVGTVAGSWWSRWWSSTGGRVAVAASAVAVLALAAVVWMRPTEPVIVADAGKHEVVMRAEGVTGLSPEGDLKTAPVELTWEAAAGAAAYRVELMEVDESVLWSSESSGTRVAVPETVQRKMLPGKPMLWRVTALDGSGKAVATSAEERFRVMGNAGAQGGAQ